MDPDKVQTVKEWPMPESIHDIQQFLGFANFYRRFIAHFAHIAKPLTSLVKPTEQFKKFKLLEEAQQAFHKLIQAFTTAGVLRHFNYHLPKRLETDASNFTIAGVLKQEHEGRWHPVAFYSQKMLSVEKNYEIHNKELLAVVACLTQWQHMLAGLPSQLVILTDHEVLKYFKLQHHITGRQARWAVLLADFNFVLQYQPGDKTGKPNALTRRVGMQPIVAPMLTMESIVVQGLRELTKTFQPLDQELWDIHAKKPSKIKDGLWYSGGRLVIPKPLATPEQPWGSILLDFIEGLPLSKGYGSILVIVDRLTKYAILALKHKTVTAEQTIMLIWRHLIRHFGIPNHMVSDWGWQFISKAWKEFARILGAKHSLSMAYHPQMDGQTEWVNQVVEQYLQMYCNYQQDDWAKLLHMAAFVYNNTVHTSIGISLFFACYRWNPKAHPDIPQQLGVNNPHRSEFLVNGDKHCKYLQEQIRAAQCQMVDQYNWKHKDIKFKVGELVYINCKNWKTKRPTPKLNTRFTGPYLVQERVGHRAYQITLPANLRVHNIFHVSMLEPENPSSLLQWSAQPVEPPLPDEELKFEVEALIRKCTHNQEVEYKVLW
ncbi:hypothetical protein NDA13_003362 [Ustilago tritici]|nr:hypothetical protein NDA13_003354 [Ustilago tritici]KAJ1027909.1 hypothetical protein NDA13_003362 [Ustilago tritici]